MALEASVLSILIWITGFDIIFNENVILWKLRVKKLKLGGQKGTMDFKGLKGFVRECPRIKYFRGITRMAGATRLGGQISLAAKPLYSQLEHL